MYVIYLENNDVVRENEAKVDQSNEQVPLFDAISKYRNCNTQADSSFFDLDTSATYNAYVYR